MTLRHPHRSRSARTRSTASAGLLLAAAAVLLAACQSGHSTASPPTSGKTTTTTAASTTNLTPLATTTTTTTATQHTTANTNVTVVTPTTPPSTTPPSTTPPSTTPSFAAVTGTYDGSTGSSGWLFIRSDGASRFRYPDSGSCVCSDATAPIAFVDFSLTSLVATGTTGHYRATGHITAESDPMSGRQLAGSVGAPVTVTIDPPGSATVSFLPPDDILVLPQSGA